MTTTTEPAVALEPLTEKVEETDQVSPSSITTVVNNLEPTVKKLKALIQALLKHSAGPIFSVPVDPIAHGCPDYLTVITEPMDLGTIMTKLEESKYDASSNDTLTSAVASDVVLTLSNCFKYNPVGHPIHDAGLALARFFENEMMKRFPTFSVDWKGQSIKDGSSPGRSKRTVKAPPVYDPSTTEGKRRTNYFSDDDLLEPVVSSGPKKRARKSESNRYSFPQVKNPDVKIALELSTLAHSLATMTEQLEKLSEQTKKKEKKVEKKVVVEKKVEPQVYLPAQTAPMIVRPPPEEMVLPPIVPVPQPKIAKPVKQPMSLVEQSTPYEERECEYCHTRETPMWRRGPSGKSSLCNKCGVKWRAGRILKNPDGTVLRPPSPDSMSPPTGPTSTLNPLKRKDKPLTLNKKGQPRKPYGFSKKVAYEQKKHVATVLSSGQLNPQQLSHIVQLIRSNMPSLKNATDEIELDIETMDMKLVAKLFKFVTEQVGILPELTSAAAIAMGISPYDPHMVMGQDYAAAPAPAMPSEPFIPNELSGSSAITPAPETEISGQFFPFQ